MRCRAYFLMIGLAVAVSGCMSTDMLSKRNALAAAGDRPITCRAGADCDEKWRRALQWLKIHSAYEITALSDNRIETAGPSGIFSAQPGFTVTKKRNYATPVPDSFAIALFPRCDNWFGCDSSAVEAKASFADFVIGSPPAAKQTLGVKVVPVSPEMAEKMQLPGVAGIAITEIAPGSVAEKAGLNEGDIIVRYNGAPVLTAEALDDLVGTTPPGQRAAVDIIRGRAPQIIGIVFPPASAK